MSEYQDIEIRWEWLAAPSVKAAELRATWARLEIHVGGETLTLVEDKESGSSRRSIYCSLYPLAEWIAFNWWFLRAHSRPASTLSKSRSYARSASDRFLQRQRHNVRSAGDGFLWPNLFILPEGGTTRLVWRADPPDVASQVIRFLTSGEVVIESSLLQQRLTDFVEVVVSRLAETGIRDTQLQVEWAAIQSTEPQEAAFCLTSARLGLDPYSEADKYEADILQAADQLDDQLLDDFMDVVQPDKISVALEWVAAAQEDIRRLTAPAADEVEALRSELSPSPDWSHLRPWERGWAQARRVRGTLGIDAADPFELQGILRASARAVPPRGLQALGGKDPDTPALVIVGNHQPEAARRFTIARALWHLLWQSESRFLVTTAYTDLQKVERAFAAELLAPAEGIAGQLSVDSIHLGVEEREIEELARKYQVSPMIVQHQLDNQILR